MKKISTIQTILFNQLRQVRRAETSTQRERRPETPTRHSLARRPA